MPGFPPTSYMHISLTLVAPRIQMLVAQYKHVFTRCTPSQDQRAVASLAFSIKVTFYHGNQDWFSWAHAPKNHIGKFILKKYIINTH